MYMFRELKDDSFYLEYKKYERCVLDYCILESTNYIGLDTHKEAVLYFVNNILKNEVRPDYMKAKLISFEELFKLPDNYEKERHEVLNNGYERPYWFLFLSPPYETNYTLNDFNKINNLLFPKGKEDLERYDWNVEWAAYFDDG